ncbi:hypothetical protein C8J56DRAFT_144625 [Mycena floridula]|nr:hypothetical protein C8J56DRAFT_144625 [Mycena floridula]
MVESIQDLDDSESVQPFPEIPPELVASIIEALVTIEPRRALNLICLSLELYPIVQRAIYRTVFLKSTSHCEKFARSDSRNHCHVRSIYIGRCGIHFLNDILTTCTTIKTLEVVCLEIPIGHDVELTAADYVRLLSTNARPQRLSCDLRWATPPRQLRGLEYHRFHLPLFENVTHLELYDILSFLKFDGSALACLGHLTHLCFTFIDPGSDSVIRLVSDLVLAESIVVCMVMVAIICNDSGSRMKLYGQLMGLPAVDPRVVFAYKSPYNNEKHDTDFPHDMPISRNFFGTHCPGLAEGELDMWEHAEMLKTVQRVK